MWSDENMVAGSKVHDVHAFMLQLSTSTSILPTRRLVQTQLPQVAACASDLLALSFDGKYMRRSQYKRVRVVMYFLV